MASQECVAVLQRWAKERAEERALLGDTAFARSRDEALTAAIDALQRQGEWIPVSERLPDSWQHVDVYPEPGEENRTYNYYTTKDGGTNGVKANRWYHNDRDGYDIEIHPTHWKPTTPILPPQPTGEQTP